MLIVKINNITTTKYIWNECVDLPKGIFINSKTYCSFNSEVSKCVHSWLNWGFYCVHTNAQEEEWLAQLIYFKITGGVTWIIPQLTNLSLNSFHKQQQLVDSVKHFSTRHSSKIPNTANAPVLLCTVSVSINIFPLPSKVNRSIREGKWNQGTTIWKW